VTAVVAATMPRARSLAARNLWLLAALLPGIALQCWRGDLALLAKIGMAMAIALLLEALALRVRRQPLAPFLLEGSALAGAALIVLWLPPLPGSRRARSVFVALVLARQAFGGLGANRFHPAMAGVACAQLLLSVPASPAAADAWLAGAWLAGGVLLLALRIARWQAALGLLAGALLGLLASGQSPALLFDPRWCLAAGFVLIDPVTSCEDARARLLSGFAAGALAALAGPGALAALPFAILALNALAPALDAWLPPRRMAGAQQ